MSEETLVFAAENGYSAITGAIRIPSELEKNAKFYYNKLIGHDRNGSEAELIINRFIYVSDTDEKARREMEQPFMEFIKFRAPDLKAALTEKYGGEENFRFDRFMEDFCLFVSPETIRRGINELAVKVGINYLLCSLNFITQNHSLCVNSTELFAREVIPNFLTRSKATQR